MDSKAIINNDKRNTILLIAAFAAVYVIWGSTYLAIKYAIETIPTFLMAGVRFTIAGAILFAVARFSKGYERPKLVHWRTSLIVGTLLLAIGNGGVVLAEHYISSSLAALLVATEPFWFVLIGWIFMGSGRPNLKGDARLGCGFPRRMALDLGPGRGRRLRRLESTIRSGPRYDCLARLGGRLALRDTGAGGKIGDPCFGHANVGRRRRAA